MDKQEILNELRRVGNATEKQTLRQKAVQNHIWLEFGSLDLEKARLQLDVLKMRLQIEQEKSNAKNNKPRRRRKRRRTNKQTVKEKEQ